MNTNNDDARTHNVVKNLQVSSCCIKTKEIVTNLGLEPQEEGINQAPLWLHL